MGRTSEDLRKNPPNPGGPRHEKGKGKEYAAMLARRDWAIAGMEPINIKDPEQVRQRIGEYFDLCLKEGFRPTLGALRLSLGIGSTSFDALIHDRYTNPHRKKPGMAIPDECTNLIKQARAVLEACWEDDMLNDAIPAGIGIFMGKNQYGYTDEPASVPDDSDEGDPAKRQPADSIIDRYADRIASAPAELDRTTEPAGTE